MSYYRARQQKQAELYLRQREIDEAEARKKAEHGRKPLDHWREWIANYKAMKSNENSE